MYKIIVYMHTHTHTHTKVARKQVIATWQLMFSSTQITSSVWLWAMLILSAMVLQHSSRVILPVVEPGQMGLGVSTEIHITIHSSTFFTITKVFCCILLIPSAQCIYCTSWVTVLYYKSFKIFFFSVLCFQFKLLFIKAMEFYHFDIAYIKNTCWERGP